MIKQSNFYFQDRSFERQMNYSTTERKKWRKKFRIFLNFSSFSPKSRNSFQNLPRLKKFPFFSSKIEFATTTVLPPKSGPTHFFAQKHVFSFETLSSDAIRIKNTSLSTWGRRRQTDCNRAHECHRTKQI